MATNGVNNVEDSEMAECDGEKVVTMMDVLQEEQDFEDDANAVLGASDEKNCTYAKGYIKRQAIYACLTCCSEAKFDPTKRAGVCLACSLNCHENHELVELYTKRNFRCDCGNPNFNSHPCQFTPNKPDLNEDNSYNQNFSGLYCTCQRPYPDPDSTVEDDEMIQCIICEDWLHASHLEATVPGVDQYAEMVCKACMEKNDFLHDYNHLVINIETQDVDVVEINGSETKLTNGDLKEKLVNGIGDSMDADEKPEDSITEKSCDNMGVDDAQKEKTEQNGDITSQAEEIKEKEPCDGTMETDTENVNDTSQIPSEVTSDSTENTTTEGTLEETPKPTEESLQETAKPEAAVEGSTTENEEKLEESTKLEEEATATEVSEEPKDSLKENVDDPENIQDAENTEKPVEKSENTEKTVENTEQDNLEPEKPEQNADPPEKNNETVEMGENKQDEVVANTENKEDESLNMDSNEINSKQEEDMLTNKDSDSTEVSAENDIQVIESEKPVETDLPTEGENKIDSTETDTITNEATSEVVTTSNEESLAPPTDINTDEAAMEQVDDEPGESTEQTAENKTEQSNDNKRKLSTEESAETDDHLLKKPKLDEESSCTRPKGVKKIHKGATFWPSNFRQKLCTCNECLSMYKDLSVLFLIDPEDTVFAYEALGKERVDGRATQYEKGLEALSSLDRIQQINALTEYNKMKDKLLDFLKSFKDRKEVVKEEDIKAFFAGMKPKREPDGVYFCR